jgi:hypothetical protein
MSKQSNRLLKVLTSSAIVFTAGGGLLIFPSSHSSKPILVQALATPTLVSSPSRSISSSSGNIGSSSSSIPFSSKKSALTRLAAEKRPMNNNNPFQNFMGDMASSLASSISGKRTGGSSNMDELDAKLGSVVSAHSWSDIRSDLESKQTPEERVFRFNVERGIGPASPLNKIRLFEQGNKEEDIRVIFYR